jgi:hypothetical protein
MTQHSVLPPSSSARRIQCPASTLLEARYPGDGQSPEAIEGEAAHWAASEMLSGRLVDVGQIAPNGHVLTQEMVEGADLYYDDVVATLKPHGLAPHQGEIEKPVAIPRVHPQSFGTPDFYAWTSFGRLLVYDYKFGHRTVEVYENAQLIEYVAGIIDPLLKQGYDDRNIVVTTKVVQPRSFHRDGPIRSWTFKAGDIRAHINLAENAAHEALGPEPKQRVGPECRDCRARHACVTLQRAAYRELDEAGREQPLDLPPAALAVELGMLRRGIERLEARASGLEEQALAMLKRGESIPGWRVEHGAGRQRWVKPAAEVLAVGQMLGLDLAKPAEPITPKQAVAAGLLPEMLASLAETPKGAAALVRDDGSKARAVFGKVAT